MQSQLLGITKKLLIAIYVNVKNYETHDKCCIEVLLACNKIKTINPTYYVQSTKCDAEFVHFVYDFELQLQRKITYEFAQPY